ncbi:phage replisome organizer N-terminal domain-containing protein [Blautia stercoris]
MGRLSKYRGRVGIKNMATGKVFYWLKLKVNFFADDGAIDFLMTQEQGEKYVLLYLMLCLKCINTDGELGLQIGEIIVPYDADKIQRDCRYFSKDTITTALELFKKLGLVYENNNGCLQIAGFHEMVGHATDWAEQKKRQRAKKTPEITDKNDTVDNVHTEYRDKSIEIRDKINNTVSIDTVRSTKVQPVIEEWNKLNLQKVISVNSGTTRNTLLNARLKEYGLEKVLEAIRSIDKSSYLKGQNRSGWTVTFDWFLKPNNFIKVLEGNYLDKGREVEQDGEDRKGETTDQYYARKYGIFQSNGSK